MAQLLGPGVVLKHHFSNNIALYHLGIIYLRSINMGILGIDHFLGFLPQVKKWKCPKLGGPTEKESSVKCSIVNHPIIGIPLFLWKPLETPWNIHNKEHDFSTSGPIALPLLFRPSGFCDIIPWEDPDVVDSLWGFAKWTKSPGHDEDDWNLN